MSIDILDVILGLSIKPPFQASPLLVSLTTGISSPRSVLYLLSRQDIGTSIAPLGIALIDSILLVFTRPNRDTIIFAYQLAFM